MKISAKNAFPNYERPPVLYHASMSAIGDQIIPRPNHTCTREEYGDFVFAGPNLDAAYCYTIKTKEMISVGSIEGSRHSACLFQSREKFMEQNPKGSIYPVDPKHFEPVPTKDGLNYTGEWISRKLIPIDPNQTITVNGIEDVMARGHQVFFLTRQPNQSETEILNSGPMKPKDIAAMVTNGLLIWENQLRGIKPQADIMAHIGDSFRQHVAAYHLPPPQ